ncbi:MAG: rhamnogalacturonan acetylesterase [bacterium]|nr:rhamnogalacturonan acetylesterase [bacterium]
MKKIIAAIAAAFAMGAALNASAASTTFLVDDKTVDTSVSLTEVTEITTNIPCMKLMIGADTWKYSKDVKSFGSVTSVGRISGTANPNIEKGTGTYYEFVFDETTEPGTLEIMYQIGENKSLYIADNGTALPDYDGSKPFEAKTTQSTTINVEASHTYTIYAAGGSKLGFYGCTYKVTNKQKDFEEEIQGLSFDMIKGDNSDTEHIQSDLALFDNYPSQFGSCDVSWRSSNTDVITNSGIVNAQKEDTVVTLTGKFSVQEDTALVQEKVFTLTVPGDPDDNAAAAGAKEALTLGDLSAVKNDIELPMRGIRGTSIIWTTSDEAVITADGKVTRAPGQDKTAVLTAEIARGEAKQTKEFTVTVLGYVPVTIDSYVYGNADGESCFSPVDGGRLKAVSYISSIKEPEEGTNVFVVIYDKDGRIKSVKADAVTADKYDKVTDIEVNCPMDSTDTFKIMSVNTGTLIPFINPVQADDTVAEGATLYVVGDSTAAAYDDTRYPRTGWAQVLQNYFDDITVVDYALSGRSSKSFKSDTNFRTLKEKIKAGDYLIIQFGHNDSKSGEADRYTDPSGDRFTEGSFKNSMLEYINIAKDKGAHPILATSISRRNIKDASLEQYVNAAKELGEELHIPVLDLYAKTKAYINEVGIEEAKSMFNWVKLKDSRFIDYPGFEKSQYYNTQSEKAETGISDTDDTHININGAELISQYATEEMARLGIPLADKVNDHKAVYPLPSYTTATTAE